MPMEFRLTFSSPLTAKSWSLALTLALVRRGLETPSGQTAILSDTVGFISELPHELISAFQATLEEVVEADIIVHVRDAAHADTRDL